MKWTDAKRQISSEKRDAYKKNSTHARGCSVCCRGTIIMFVGALGLGFGTAAFYKHSNSVAFIAPSTTCPKLKLKSHLTCRAFRHLSRTRGEAKRLSYPLILKFFEVDFEVEQEGGYWSKKDEQWVNTTYYDWRGEPFPNEMLTLEPAFSLPNVY